MENKYEAEVFTSGIHQLAQSMSHFIFPSVLRSHHQGESFALPSALSHLVFCERIEYTSLKPNVFVSL